MKKGGIYIHIPFCKRKCNYCAFVSVCDFSLMQAYVESLIEEIKERAHNELIDTVYFGGGTPSVLYRGAISCIMDAIRQNYNLDDSLEITVEANPDSVTEEFVSECVECGINRFSLGLQSSSDRFLKEAGRLHTRRRFENALDVIRKTGIENVSVDLMYGFEGQTIEDVKIDLEYVVSKKVNHVSIYALSIEEGTPFAQTGYSVDDDMQADMYELISEFLQKNGYFRYEVSNFAKKGYESRHNGKYWSGANYYGFGAAAHSLVDGVRLANTSSVSDYVNEKRIAERTVLNKNDLIEERIMLSLRRAEGVNLLEFENDFGYDLTRKKRDAIEKMVNGGLIEVDGGWLRVTDKGIFVLNSIILELMD